MAGCLRFFTFIQCFDLPALIGPVSAFADHTIKPELACLAEQVRADLALLKWRGENAIRPSCEQLILKPPSQVIVPGMKHLITLPGMPL